MRKPVSDIPKNHSITSWFNLQTIEDISLILNSTLSSGIHRICITGGEGFGKHDLIYHLIQRRTSNHLLIQHLNFALEKFSMRKFLSDAFLFHLKKLPEFKSYLKNYPLASRQYIKERLAVFPHSAEVDLDWYFEIFLQFLRHASHKKIILIVLENLNQLDSYQFDRLDSFIKQLKEFPVYVVATFDPDGTFKHKLPDYHQVLLSKLSIQSVEKSIQTYLKTSAINARLITNHCFLKTNGNALKIRYLLYAFYHSILQKDLIEIQKLQRLKIPESWEEIFPMIFSQILPKNSRLLIFLSYLNEPMMAKDLEPVFISFKLKSQILSEWLKCGILKEINYRGQLYYDIRQLSFKKWLRNQASLDDIKEILLKFGQLSEQKKFHTIYPLSELVYGVGEIEMASRLAVLEGDSYLKIGDFDIAADRFYFALRISENHELLPPLPTDILEKLGDIYLSRESYENAFEVFKRLRIAYSDSDKFKQGNLQKKWMQVNLKMIHALVEMDSFQEARYLIREIQVKEFTDVDSLGKSLELLGDIEGNLARVDQARQNYWNSFQYFQKANNIEGLFSVYFKLRSHLKKQPEVFNALIKQILEIIPDKAEFLENRAWILRDRIGLFLNEKRYMDALKDTYELRRILRKIYYPRLKVQHAFYAGEIYPHLGKWQLALSILRAINKETYVIHRPELNVQTLIQLGMIFKEQAIYGDARRILNSGMEICFRNGLHQQINEIKLHLGHIYLLVHSLLRANELLKEVHDWSDRYGVGGIQFLAKLYLSYYELQQNRLQNARQFLTGAKKILNSSVTNVDYLNYLFYLCLWLLKAERVNQAMQVVNLMLRKVKDYPRYQAASYFLQGKVYLQMNNSGQAEKIFKKAMSISRRQGFPQIQYLILCEIARDSLLRGDQKEIKVNLPKACKFIREMADNIGDEILAVQFKESKFHEDLLHHCREHHLFKNEN
jgi:tetratricopeptide (TPR) repeat protein